MKKKENGGILGFGLFGGSKATEVESPDTKDQYCQMIKQLKGMLKDQKKFDQSSKCLEKTEKKNNQSLQLLKSLVKTYSDDALFRPINEIITKGQYDKLQGYLSLLLMNLRVFG